MKLTLVWSRVDCKLIHGQTAAAWIPHLGADVVVVADGDAAEDPWSQKLMRLSLPPEVKELIFASPREAADLMAGRFAAENRVFLIFKNLAGALEALKAGLEPRLLNLGNQLETEGESVKVSETFVARREELAALARWRDLGLEVVLQPAPAARPLKWKP